MENDMRQIKLGFTIMLICVNSMCACAREEGRGQFIRLGTTTIKENKVLVHPFDHNKEYASPSEETPVQDKQEVFHNANKLLPLTLFVQETNYYCGPAAIKTILHYFGIHKSQHDLAEELKTHAVTGSEYVDLVNVLNHYLFNNDISGNVQGAYHVETLPLHAQDLDLKQTWLHKMCTNINDGYPSIIAVDLHVLYPSLASANHVVICTGYTKNLQTDEITHIYILDPYYGVQDAKDGGLKSFTPDVLWASIIENEEPAYIW